MLTIRAVKTDYDQVTLLFSDEQKHFGSISLPEQYYDEVYLGLTGAVPLLELIQEDFEKWRK